jgi:hypothetical protein
VFPMQVANNTVPTVMDTRYLASAARGSVCMRERVRTGQYLQVTYRRILPWWMDTKDDWICDSVSVM